MESLSKSKILQINKKKLQLNIFFNMKTNERKTYIITEKTTAIYCIYKHLIESLKSFTV